MGFICMLAKPYLPAVGARLYHWAPEQAHQLLERIDGSERA